MIDVDEVYKIPNPKNENKEEEEVVSKNKNQCSKTRRSN